MSKGQRAHHSPISLPWRSNTMVGKHYCFSVTFPCSCNYVHYYNSSNFDQPIVWRTRTCLFVLTHTIYHYLFVVLLRWRHTWDQYGRGLQTPTLKLFIYSYCSQSGALKHSKCIYSYLLHNITETLVQWFGPRPTYITLFISITMFRGNDNIQHNILPYFPYPIEYEFCRILSVSQNIGMDMNDFM